MQEVSEVFRTVKEARVVTEIGQSVELEVPAQCTAAVAAAAVTSAVGEAALTKTLAAPMPVAVAVVPHTLTPLLSPTWFTLKEFEQVRDKSSSVIVWLSKAHPLRSQ
ncbi:unannotated protein [freshwater metagenome]|uniref:Unannotated protein n=1 Tax=freshwater metagenome TaxID=449393 RepID=A0A6J6JPW6_9ZZZZ